MQDGGELPEHITREEYNKAREAYRTGDNSLQAWYIGAAGFLASYNGRFYDGGYAGYGKDKGRVRDYYRESRNNILMQMQQGGIFGIDFSCRDYKSYTPQGCVIYCDPPYEGTKKYGNAKDFDYLEFWETMRKWSRHNNIVLISELQAPDDFITIWENNTRQAAIDRAEIGKHFDTAINAMLILYSAFEASEMTEEEITKWFEAMEREAKKEIDTGADKTAFMCGISRTAAGMAGKNPKYARFITDKAKEAIENIAKYKGQQM